LNQQYATFIAHKQVFNLIFRYVPLKCEGSDILRIQFTKWKLGNWEIGLKIANYLVINFLILIKK